MGLYKILEVSRTACREVIDKAYSVLVAKYDPDRYPEEKRTWAEEQLQRVNYAYEVLSDRERGAHYDADASEAVNPDLEQLVVKANRFMELEEYALAHAVFEQVTQKYPDDVRGWWGLIQSYTEQAPVRSDDRTDAWFEKAVLVADLDTCVKLNLLYKERKKQAIEEHRIAVLDEEIRVSTWWGVVGWVTTGIAAVAAVSRPEEAHFWWMMTAVVGVISLLLFASAFFGGQKKAEMERS